MPLKVQNVDVSKNSSSNNINDFSLGDLMEAAVREPNLMTEEIHIKNDILFARISQVLPLIVYKFPNLKSISISNQHRAIQEEFEDNFSSLSSLANLEELKIFNFASEHLKLSTIPSLKCFQYSSFGFGQILEESAADDLIDFLSRHQKVQELNISFSGMPAPKNSEKIVKEIAEYAVENLKNLSFLSVNEDNFSI